MNLRYIDLDENLLTRGSDGTYYRLRIGQDDWIDSPRDWSPLGHMLCWNRRYNCKRAGRMRTRAERTCKKLFFPANRIIKPFFG